MSPLNRQASLFVEVGSIKIKFFLKLLGTFINTSASPFFNQCKNTFITNGSGAAILQESASHIKTSQIKLIEVYVP